MFKKLSFFLYFVGLCAVPGTILAGPADESLLNNIENVETLPAAKSGDVGHAVGSEDDSVDIESIPDTKESLSKKEKMVGLVKRITRNRDFRNFLRGSAFTAEVGMALATVILILNQASESLMNGGAEGGPAFLAATVGTGVSMLSLHLASSIVLETDPAVAVDASWWQRKKRALGFASLGGAAIALVPVVIAAIASREEDGY